ncbi:MAG: hypothetical protein CL850_01385 [Crocinitomicaceae bacterium]|nr:hypothetical protein [Crocinitomicaceae bacterium]|tara:strand:- start:1685 stop:2791 length:1107 start_codon:yes stop_codon:yes gene_type:complete
MYRIALNARLLIPGKLEGTGRFTHQCYKRLVSLRPEDKFLLIFDRPPPMEFDYGENVETVCLLPPARRPWLFDVWFDYAVTWKIKKWNANLFVSTDGYISRRTLTPQLNVIHDINFEHNPDWLPSRYSKHFRKRFPEYARFATKLCTVSNYSRVDISKCYGIAEDAITVIPNSSDAMFIPIDERSKQAARDQFCEGKRYIVFVGSLHPRKNITGIVKAFEEYRRRGGSSELLMVGVSMWKDEKREALGVHYAGRLNDNALAKAVAAAEAMLYLPFFEGFGVPIIEAMACGVPVVASNCTSVPEVCGDAAAALVDPNDYDAAAKGLLKLEVDREFRQQVIQSGLMRSKDYSWDRSAEILSNEIDQLLNA